MLFYRSLLVEKNAGSEISVQNEDPKPAYIDETKHVNQGIVLSNAKISE